VCDRKKYGESGGQTLTNTRLALLCWLFFLDVARLGMGNTKHFFAAAAGIFLKNK